MFSSFVLLLFFSICLLQTDRTIFTWDELKLLNENLYDNVYLASFGRIFACQEPAWRAFEKERKGDFGHEGNTRGAQGGKE